MKFFDLILPIDDTANLIIELKEPLNCIDCCYRTDIVFLQANKKLLLSNEPILYAMRSLRDLLKKALTNKLYLHKSITDDIGYLFNEYHYLENKSNFILETSSDETSYWVGYKHHLWEAEQNNSRSATWIYSNDHKDMIFEITPCYPYMYCEPEEEPNYIPYHEWIKTYKPYFVTTISQETAQQWIIQAELIINTIEDNVRRWEMENDNKNI